MFDKSDPRTRLSAAKGAPPASDFVSAEVCRFYGAAPQITEGGSRTWASRGQNFILLHTEAAPGAVLERHAQPDEYVLLLPDRETGAIAEAGGERIEAEGYSLVIVPPGDSRVHLPEGGRAVRVFSPCAEDLASLCSNAESFATRWPNIPPYAPWPAPLGGYRIRVYSLDVPPEPGRFGRIFRCSTLMINVLDPLHGPRDITKLSPHHHDDFEQGSLALAGSFTHHMRWPWVPDMTKWRDDQHVLVGAPSLTIIPPPVVHTSRGMEDGLNQLIDIFSPPRRDFSMQPGWVINADDYPMPVEPPS